MSIKNETTALNMAKFLASQSLVLLEKLNSLDLDEFADDCERLHDELDILHKKLSQHLLTKHLEATNS